MINIIQKCLSYLDITPICLLCQSKLKGYARICRGCHTDLPWVRHACPRCAQPLPAGQAVCGPCQKTPPAYDRIHVALDYHFPVDKLIMAGKFGQRLGHLNLLAELFADYWQQHALPKPDLLIPVPLHRKRQRERGYNQALEMARWLSQHLAIPLDSRSVVRNKATLAQASLPAKQRQGNIKNAFCVQATKALPAKVAIVDDVFTTGSTVSALSQSLRQAGVEYIEVYCVARSIKV